MYRLILVVGILLLPVGCSSGRGSVEQNLMADFHSNLRGFGVAESYRVGCPDVLEVTVEGRPELSGREEIDPEGRLPLPQLGSPRVEGRTVRQIAQELAIQLGVALGSIRVRVVEYRSQRVFLFGEVSGQQRSLPYQGPETVLDLLQRAGGITPGAEPNDVYVIRANIGSGRRPEVFHVDLRAIVLRKDHRTNIRLLPFDQVHVGETRESYLQRCVPPCLRPLYKLLCHTRPRLEPLSTSPPRPRPSQPPALVSAS